MRAPGPASSRAEPALLHELEDEHPGCTATAGVLTEQGITVAQLQNTGKADESDALTSAIAAALAAGFRAVGGSL